VMDKINLPKIVRVICEDKHPRWGIVRVLLQDRKTKKTYTADFTKREYDWRRLVTRLEAKGVSKADLTQVMNIFEKLQSCETRFECD